MLYTTFWSYHNERMCTLYSTCFIHKYIINWLLFLKLKSQKPWCLYFGWFHMNLQWFFIYMSLFPKEVKSDKSLISSVKGLKFLYKM